MGQRICHLKPDVPCQTETLHPMPFKAAAQMEMDLAEDLRRAGYTVTGGH
jgi:hypothetical protein